MYHRYVSPSVPARPSYAFIRRSAFKAYGLADPAARLAKGMAVN